MLNQDKYPEIWAAKVKAEKEHALLMSERRVHTDKIAEVQTQIDALKIQKENLNEKAMKDIERLRELRRDISRLAKAMGAIVAK